MADGGINHNLLSEPMAVNAGPLDRDELLKLVHLLTVRLASMSMVAGSLIDQIPNRSTDRETVLYQFMAALEGPDDKASSHGRRNTLNFERLRRPCRFRRTVFNSGIG